MKIYKLGPHKEPILSTMEEFIEDARKDIRHMTDPIQRLEIDGITVSTVFLRMDASGVGRVFETMIFAADHPLNQAQWRCATWVESVYQHHKACRLALAPHGYKLPLIRDMMW